MMLDNRVDLLHGRDDDGPGGVTEGDFFLILIIFSSVKYFPFESEPMQIHSVRINQI